MIIRSKAPLRLGLAGSVVTKDVKPWTIVGGNPAKRFVNASETWIINRSIGIGLHCEE